MIKAIKPIKFGKQYGVGDIVPNEVVSPFSLQKLILAGYLKIEKDGNITESEVVEEPKENIGEIEEKTEDILEEIEENLEEIETEDDIVSEIPLSVLKKMNKSKLKELLTVNQIKYDEKDTNEVLINKFINKGE